ncbi:hypothetical protein DL96DRAFT_1598796 [Flagelloscypha sp. PMI_526]|nr:hypothetical protein DL96DRAFT_1598796 [Flagelloscypha sp. PMI_526]
MLFRSLAPLALAASALGALFLTPLHRWSNEDQKLSTSKDPLLTLTGSRMSAMFINWSYSSSDPNPIDIIITNGNETTLNGAFSIERNVDLTNGTYTVSNVTLKVGSGYKVSFVNGTNQTQSKAPGTPASDSEDAKPHSASSAASGSATATAAGGSSSNAPAPNSAVNHVAPFLMAAGLVVLSGLGALF